MTKNTPWRVSAQARRCRDQDLPTPSHLRESGCFPSTAVAEFRRKAIVAFGYRLLAQSHVSPVNQAVATRLQESPL